MSARYKVVRQEWTPNWDCDHPMCDPLHKRWHRRRENGLGWECHKPVAPQVEWIIVDTETGDRAEGGPLSESFELRRDAVRCLKSFLLRQERTAPQTVTCSSCRAEVQPLELFPKNRCLACHARAHQNDTPADLLAQIHGGFGR